MLEVDGKVIGQSVTIARFAAQLAGIFGDDIYEQAKYDAVVGACQEVLELWGFWEFEMDAQRKVCLFYFLFVFSLVGDFFYRKVFM